MCSRTTGYQVSGMTLLAPLQRSDKMNHSFDTSQSSNRRIMKCDVDL